uniref:Ribonuclease A-domain domain-containing protein n=1 Tax=Sparus aurata TaxID=8175 RepID=A0A671XL53_SPAAU
TRCVLSVSHIQFYCSHIGRLGNSGVPVQSFIDASEVDVQQICRKGGHRVKNGGNLCISASSMTVYDVKSKHANGQCTVTSLIHRQQEVVVACNKVGNVCLPVHYQGYENQQPTKQNCS